MPPQTHSASVPWCHGWADTTRSSTRPPFPQVNDSSSRSRGPGTLIVIAHRISSALRARRVLVLDGVRAQAGDHASLLASSPMYRDLAGYWNVASQQETPGLEPSGR